MLIGHHPAADRGTSMVEVLVTLVILAFGLLGVAGLQSKIGVAEMESYQRAQALVALTQMTERLSATSIAQAPNYVSNNVGTGDTQPANCSAIAQGPNRDLCQWSNTLKGTTESRAGTSTGGLTGGRGCIIQVQPQVPALGVCSAGIYQVSVAWQGMAPTAAPPANQICAAGQYGANDAYRRVIAATVSFPTTSCF